MRKLILFAAALGVSFITATTVQAVTVVHNGVVVVHDEFDGVAPGGSPDPAIWEVILPDYGGQITVVDDESPGAYSGDQYVKFQGEVVGDGPYIMIRAAFPDAGVDSGAIHAEWMMYIPDPGGLTAGVFAFHELTQNRARTYGSWNKVTAGEASSYVPGVGWADADVPISYDTWQKWEMDMTDPWAETWTLSVDGATSAELPVWRYNKDLRYFSIGMSVTTSTFYIDGAPYIVLPGDANGDGEVNETDAAALAANWLTDDPEPTWAMGDFNNDGKVDDVDATMMATNWTGGQTPLTVPEPSAMLLLAMGGIAAIFITRLKRR